MCVKKTCVVSEGTTTMNLKVVKSAPDPFLVMDHLVPIFTVDKNSFHEDQWDLTTQQVCIIFRY